MLPTSAGHTQRLRRRRRPPGRSGGPPYPSAVPVAGPNARHAGCRGVADLAGHAALVEPAGRRHGARRTHDVQAALTGLDRSWRPCRVEADGQQVDFTLRPRRPGAAVQRRPAGPQAGSAWSPAAAARAQSGTDTASAWRARTRRRGRRAPRRRELPASAVMPKVSRSTWPEDDEAQLFPRSASGRPAAAGGPAGPGTSGESGGRGRWSSRWRSAAGGSGRSSGARRTSGNGTRPARFCITTPASGSWARRSARTRSCTVITRSTGSATSTGSIESISVTLVVRRPDVPGRGRTAAAAQQRAGWADGRAREGHGTRRPPRRDEVVEGSRQWWWRTGAGTDVHLHPGVVARAPSRPSSPIGTAATSRRRARDRPRAVAVAVRSSPCGLTPGAAQGAAGGGSSGAASGVEDDPVKPGARDAVRRRVVHAHQHPHRPSGGPWQTVRSHGSRDRSMRRAIMSAISAYLAGRREQVRRPPGRAPRGRGPGASCHAGARVNRSGTKPLAVAGTLSSREATRSRTASRGRRRAVEHRHRADDQAGRGVDVLGGERVGQGAQTVHGTPPRPVSSPRPLRGRRRRTCATVTSDPVRSMRATRAWSMPSHQVVVRPVDDVWLGWTSPTT